MFDKDFLKKLIDQTQISQQQIATALGVPFATLRGYLKGEQPGVTNLVKMADYFAVPLDSLMGRCSQKQLEKILEDYPNTFMKIRGSGYKKYLIGRRRFKELGNGDFEAPYPYNLFEAIFSKPIDWIITDTQLENLDKALNTLSDKEKDCILAYFKEGKCLNTVGEERQICRERVRQIISNALRILRHPSRRSGLTPEWHSFEEIDEYAKKRLAEIKKIEDAILQKEKIISQREQNFNDYLTYLKNNGYAEEADAILNKVSYDSNDLSSLKIEKAGFSNRLYNILKRAGYNSLNEIETDLQNNPLVIVNIRSMGPKTYSELLRKLDLYYNTGNKHRLNYSYEQVT